MHRAVGEGDFPVFVLPRAGMLQPIHVVTFRKILARLRPARFGTRSGGVRNHHRLVREIGKLQGRDQCHIPL